MKGDVMPNRSIADIDVKLLRVFCTIVECDGFSQAQSELNLSRSTISTHMANLETRVGFKLCSRGRAGFALTAGSNQMYQIYADAQKLAANNYAYAKLTAVEVVDSPVLAGVKAYIECTRYQDQPQSLID